MQKNQYCLLSEEESLHQICTIRAAGVFLQRLVLSILSVALLICSLLITHGLACDFSLGAS
jgi:hypothetical protein